MRMQAVKQNNPSKALQLGTLGQMWDYYKLDFSQDYHSLNFAQQNYLSEIAQAIGYHKPKNANGSTSRYLFAFLARSPKALQKVLDKLKVQNPGEIEAVNPNYSFYVKIVKASKPTFWYADKIGKIFEVRDEGGNTYQVYEYGHEARGGINKNDAVKVRAEHATGRVGWKRRNAGEIEAANPTAELTQARKAVKRLQSGRLGVRFRDNLAIQYKKLTDGYGFSHEIAKEAQRLEKSVEKIEAGKNGATETTAANPRKYDYRISHYGGSKMYSIKLPTPFDNWVLDRNGHIWRTPTRAEAVKVWRHYCENVDPERAYRTITELKGYYENPSLTDFRAKYLKGTLTVNDILEVEPQLTREQAEKTLRTMLAMRPKKGDMIGKREDEPKGRYTSRENNPQIQKTFKTLRQAERFQDKLYGQYDYVRLVRSPMFTEGGVYVWDVRNGNGAGVAGNPSNVSYVSKVWAMPGTTLIGGVKTNTSARFESEHDAKQWVWTLLEIAGNNIGRQETVKVNKPPQIRAERNGAGVVGNPGTVKYYQTSFSDSPRHGWTRDQRFDTLQEAKDEVARQTNLDRSVYWRIDGYNDNHRLVKSFPIRANGADAKRNHTAAEFRNHQKIKLAELIAMFQGQHKGEKIRVAESDYTPRDKYKLGYLVQLKIKDARKIVPINFDGESYLAADLRNNLLIVGKDSCLEGVRRPSRGGLKYLGELIQIDYVTAKKHIGGGKTIRFYHKLGEVTGEHPNLFMDDEGFLIIQGGGYDVWDVGIVN